jgi:integrase
MASVLKRKIWVDARGKRATKSTPGAKVRLSDKWWIKIPLPHGRCKWYKGFTDKGATQQRAATIVRDMARGEVGLIDLYAAHRTRPLTDHLKDFASDLRSKGRATMYVYNIEKRITALLATTGWQRLADITPDGFVAWRDSVASIGPTTKNQYLEALGAMCRWCVKRNRVAADPTAGIDRVDNTADIRRGRRALTDDEVTGLLKAATPEHAAVYRLILATGLRRNEVANLEWGDIRLDAVRPFISLRASTTKAKRADTLPLRVELASELRDRRAAAGDVSETDRVYADLPTIDAHKDYLMAAGIAFVDDRKRRADLHALRHTFGTNLARADVSVREAMELMRHTDMRLTTKVYTDPKAFNLSAAVERLPSTHRPDDQRAKAIGTFEGPTDVARSDLRYRMRYRDAAPSGTDRPKTAATTSTASRQNHPVNTAESRRLSSHGTEGQSGGKSWGTRIRT